MATGTTAAQSSARLALDTSLKLVERILVRIGRYPSQAPAVDENAGTLYLQIKDWVREHVFPAEAKHGACQKVVLREVDAAGGPRGDVAIFQVPVVTDVENDVSSMACIIYDKAREDLVLRESPDGTRKDSGYYAVYAYHMADPSYTPRIFLRVFSPRVTAESPLAAQHREEREHGRRLAEEIDAVAAELRRLLRDCPEGPDHYAATMRTAANRLRDIVDQVRARCSDHDCDCCFGYTITSMIDELMESSANVLLVTGAARTEPFVTSVSHCLGKDIDWGVPFSLDLDSHDALATCVSLLSPRYDVMICHDRQAPNNVRILLDDVGGRFRQEKP